MPCIEIIKAIKALPFHRRAKFVVTVKKRSEGTSGTTCQIGGQRFSE